MQSILSNELKQLKLWCDSRSVTFNTAKTQALKISILFYILMFSILTEVALTVSVYVSCYCRKLNQDTENVRLFRKCVFHQSRLNFSKYKRSVFYTRFSVKVCRTRGLLVKFATF